MKLDPTKCQHFDFRASVTVVRLEDIGRFRAEVHVQCMQCETPFRFVGLPMGMRTEAPTASVDGLEANLPIEPGPCSKAEFEKRLAQGLRYEIEAKPGTGEEH